MDDKIIGLYAAGLSTRDIRAHLEEVYGLKVSADLISRVTDAVLEEVSDWQNRALEPMYPIVFLDALRVKIRDAESRQVKNKAVYVALGVTPEGEREVLGLWIAANEGAKFWLSMMNNLRNRGVEDILIAVVDGLKGFPDAINAAFPESTAKGAANISFDIRRGNDDLNYLDMDALAVTAEGSKSTNGQPSLWTDAINFKPVRNAVGHTGLLTPTAKSHLNITFENIRARIKALFAANIK